MISGGETRVGPGSLNDFMTSAGITDQETGVKLYGKALEDNRSNIAAALGVTVETMAAMSPQEIAARRGEPGESRLPRVDTGEIAGKL